MIPIIMANDRQRLISYSRLIVTTALSVFVTEKLICKFFKVRAVSATSRWSQRHSILCKRLQLTFGMDGQVLARFSSYLHGRSQYVRRGMLKSLSVLLICGVLQGSVLGSILFILYTLYTVSGKKRCHFILPVTP